MRSFYALVGSVALVSACAGSGVSDTTTTDAPSTTTTSSTTTTTVASTTSSTTPLSTFTYFIGVYDQFEADTLEVGSPCIATGGALSIASGFRVFIRQDAGGEAIGISELEDGQVAFDYSGPAEGGEDSELFYYCQFGARFESVPLMDGDVYAVELPGDTGISPPLTKDDLMGDRFTSLTQSDREEERQRMRASG